MAFKSFPPSGKILKYTFHLSGPLSHSCLQENSEYSDENKSLNRWNVFPLDSCPRDQHFHLLYEGQVAGALGSAPDQLSHHGNGWVEA